MTLPSRLPAQLAFLIEADKLKSVNRPNPLADGTRLENAAEQAWHLCLWALLFEDCSQGANLPRVIQMLLLHALPQIETGLPPDVSGDPEAEDAHLAQAQQAAARLFALLPADQTVNYQLLWDECAQGVSTDARYAQMLIKAAPVFCELAQPALSPEARDSLQAALTTGAFADLHDDWPELHAHADNLLHRRRLIPMEPLGARLRFVMEADRLKSVLRATTLCDGTRRENSAEHSWHLMLYALTLDEHSIRPVHIDHVMLMLLIHDLVEIDAGDTPIHGSHDTAAMDAKEQAAADRIYGLLPAPQRDRLRAIWEEFEAASSDDAIFAKALDRVQPVICNLECGGGTWPAYNVTRAQLQSRVGVKVRRGAPAIWEELETRIDAWFTAHG